MPDKVVVRVVAAGLSILALAVVVFGGLLALDDKTMPDALVAIGSGAAGALAALLARTSTEPGP